MESTLGIGQAARLLGPRSRNYSAGSAKGDWSRWRTASNRRRYIESPRRIYLRLPSPAVPRPILAYCRISSAAQCPDLINQRDVLKGFAATHYAALHGCELLLLKQQRLSAEQEIVQDLMTVVYGCSSCLHGLRNYRRQLRAALEGGHAAGTSDQD